MENHANTVVGRYVGRIAQWDVVNEPLALLGSEIDPRENIFFRVLGEHYLDITAILHGLLKIVNKYNAIEYSGGTGESTESTVAGSNCQQHIQTANVSSQISYLDLG